MSKRIILSETSHPGIPKTSIHLFSFAQLCGYSDTGLIKFVLKRSPLHKEAKGAVWSACRWHTLLLSPTAADLFQDSTKAQGKAAHSTSSTLETDRHGQDNEGIYRPLVSNLHPMKMLILCRVIVSIIIFYKV